VVVDAVITKSADGWYGKTPNYSVIDIYTVLVPIAIQYLNDGGTEQQIATQRVALLNKALVRCMMWDHVMQPASRAPTICFCLVGTCATRIVLAQPPFVGRRKGNQCVLSIVVAGWICSCVLGTSLAQHLTS